ncbi:MAG: DUF1343 domain-containing protein [Ignavibacteriae bacterium]|nr:DUF1343 domain-containing protein [Ignavibacteriota bacterium]
MHELIQYRNNALQSIAYEEHVSCRSKRRAGKKRRYSTIWNEKLCRDLRPRLTGCISQSIQILCITILRKDTPLSHRLIGTLITSALFVLTFTSFSQTPNVKLGIDVLRDRGFDVLKGKRIGLITNPTGVDSRVQSTIDILSQAPDVKLVALYGPEHGVRGNFAAGDKIETIIDSATNVPMYSLYGKTRKPTAEMLRGIDALVYDIQDIGCRSYTYISTMGLAMEAAAENNIECIVLDRPNPLGGIKIEGNIVEAGYESFVSPYPIPYVYGLTCGELAKLLNEEGMLKNKARCKLIVVPMQGWKRSMTFAQTGLQWVPTSPHVPEAASPAYYVSTGILGELGVLSEGVGYTIPFHTCAAEWINGKRFAEKLNALNVDGVLFRPLTIKPFYGKHKDKNLNGVQIHLTDESKVNLMSIQFLCMQVHHELYPDKNPFELADGGRLKTFDRIVGSDRVRKLFTQRMSYADVKSYLEKDVQTFSAKAKRYYLY